MHHVVRGSSAGGVREASPGSLVVLGRGQLRVEGPEADLAIRFGVGARIAGLLFCGTGGEVMLSTARLADRHDLPLVLVSGNDVDALVAELEAETQAPEIAATRRLRTLLRAVGPHTEPGELLRLLHAELRAPVALLDANGHPLEGDRATDWAALLGAAGAELGADVPVARILDAPDGAEVVLLPVVLPPGRRAGMWFAALAAASDALPGEQVKDCLAVAALAFTAHLAGRSFARVHEGRERALLLTEILETSPFPDRETVERAAVLGWRLSGWHTAVHLAITGTRSDRRPVGALTVLEDALGRAGLPVAIVDRPDGWMFWRTEDAPPDRAAIAALVKAVRSALLDPAVRDSLGRVCAGIGLAHTGTEGIAESAEESRRAAMVARAREVDGAVELTDPVGLRRLLHAWYAHEPVKELATEVLAPLREADPTDQLGRTLACFLDHESSLVTTAAVLGVHRNTVVHRLSRIRAALGVDLADPDDRLAAHLATRAVVLPDRAGSDDQGGDPGGSWQGGAGSAHRAYSGPATKRAGASGRRDRGE
ncbi:PucR family transcriptional regulator [Pseudonocardia benzenivorans]